MDTHSSASGPICPAARPKMLLLTPNSPDSSSGSDSHCIGVFPCDMCTQYLTHVAIDGGEPLDEGGLSAARILASMVQDGSEDMTAPDNISEDGTEYVLDGEDGLPGSMIELGGSGGAALGRMVPAQPSYQTKSGAGAFQKRKAEEQGESSAQGLKRARGERAAWAGPIGVKKTTKLALSMAKRAPWTRRLETTMLRMKEQTFSQYKRDDRGESAVALNRMGYPAKDSGVAPELVGRYSDS